MPFRFPVSYCLNRLPVLGRTRRNGTLSAHVLPFCLFISFRYELPYEDITCYSTVLDMPKLRNCNSKYCMLVNYIYTM